MNKFKRAKRKRLKISMNKTLEEVKKNWIKTGRVELAQELYYDYLLNLKCGGVSAEDTLSEIKERLEVELRN